MANFCEGLDGIDVCRFPRDYFPWLAADDPATDGHQDCWVGMSTTDDFGQHIGFPHRGQACEVGCRSCPDLPDELSTSRAAVDGLRWLYPHPQLQSIDATGTKAALRASHVNLIPRFATKYLMGQCFDNDGVECFHDSVCGCFGERSGNRNIGNEGEPPTIDRCIPTAGNRWYARGFFPNQFTYLGMDHPLQVTGFGLSVAGGMFCRPFVKQNRDGTVGDEDLIVSLEGGDMYSPAFVRDAHRFVDAVNTCTVNAMVVAVGAVPDSTCSDAYRNAWEFSIPQGVKPEFYNGSSSSRNSFRLIRISGDPHFRDINNKFDGLTPRDLAHVKAKTAAVKAVFDSTFPDGGTGIRFDQVTHTHGGSPQEFGPLNAWERTWKAADYDISPEGLPVVETFPITGRWPNLPNSTTQDGKLVITEVESRLWLMPLSAYDSRYSPPRPFIEYHARYRLRIKLGILTELSGEGVTLDQPWLPDDHPDRHIDDLFIDYRPPLSEPTLSRTDLGLKHVWKDGNGVPVELPTNVEWLGYLGQVSQPTAESTRHEHGGNVITAIRDGARGLKIHGWPFAHGTTKGDSGKKDTAQIHGGSIEIEFVN